MSIADWAAYKAMMGRSPRLNPPIDFQKTSLTVGATGNLMSLWTAPGGFPASGGAITTAAVPTQSTAGGLGAGRAAGASEQRILETLFRSSTRGYVIICDRLSHQGGLNATTTGAQTTNLPTAALPARATGGDGVWAALEVYTQIGATGTTITCSYTNQAGTAGRTSPAVAFGGTGFREAGRFIPIPLASGDTGVRSVENVNIVATTGTAGAFGVTLFKPLMAFPLSENVETLVGAVLGICNAPVLDDAACIWPLYVPATTATGTISAQFNLYEV